MSARQAHEHGTAPFKVGDTVRCYALPARVIEIVRRAPHPTDEQRLGTWTRVERFGVVFIDDHEHRTGQG
jgi:hypothetical protein